MHHAALHKIASLVGYMVGVALFLWLAEPALADVGPAPIAPPGSSLQPDSQTPIRMAAESVSLNIRASSADDQALLPLSPASAQWSTDWLPAVAEVRADFRLLNPTANSITMKVWFPLSADLKGEPLWLSVGDFQVEVAGQAVGYEEVELPNPGGADQPALPWASFQVVFPSGQETVIRVTYLLPAQTTPGDQVGMEFAYIFQTGAGWDRPIGLAELFVSLPYLASDETLGEAPPGMLIQGSQLSWRWSSFEPEAGDDFRIHLLQPQHWPALQDARAAVAANPQDGQAWLSLGRLYQHLTHTKGPTFARSFGKVFQPFGVQAFQEAARLLPGDPAPHAGLADQYLARLFTTRQASPDDLELVQNELRLAEELLVGNPSDDARLQIELARAQLESFQQQASSATAQAQNSPAPELTSTPASTPTLNPTNQPTANTVPTTLPAGAEPRKRSSLPLLLGGMMILLAGGLLLVVGLIQRQS